jgi:hypothetical protein
MLGGAGLWGVGGLRHADTAVSTDVLTTTMPAPTPTSIASVPVIAPTTPPSAVSPSALPILSATTAPVAPVITAQTPPPVIDETEAGPTTPVTAVPSTTTRVAPTTSTEPTVQATIAPPTTSVPHHGGNKPASAPDRVGTHVGLQPKVNTTGVKRN